ncbi:MAG: hypothetical protein JWN37_284 [Candidatus Nomurabacteria bacterium]|nr:hypothetical protein [Candidatus Nomurabacteria bacterium]
MESHSLNPNERPVDSAIESPSSLLESVENKKEILLERIEATSSRINEIHAKTEEEIKLKEKLIEKRGLLGKMKEKLSLLGNAAIFLIGISSVSALAQTKDTEQPPSPDSSSVENIEDYKNTSDEDIELIEKQNAELGDTVPRVSKGEQTPTEIVSASMALVSFLGKETLKPVTRDISKIRSESTSLMDKIEAGSNLGRMVPGRSRIFASYINKGFDVKSELANFKSHPERAMLSALNFATSFIPHKLLVNAGMAILEYKIIPAYKDKEQFAKDNAETFPKQFGRSE